MLAANCVWLLFIFGWTFGHMVPFFYLLKVCGLLRVSPQEEEVRENSEPPRVPDMYIFIWTHVTKCAAKNVQLCMIYFVVTMCALPCMLYYMLAMSGTCKVTVARHCLTMHMQPHRELLPCNGSFACCCLQGCCMVQGATRLQCHKLKHAPWLCAAGSGCEQARRGGV